MPTIIRAHSLRFVIYVEDHEPAHVHVIGDGVARIVFAGGALRVERIQGLSKRDVRRALDVVDRHRAELLAA